MGKESEFLESHGVYSQLSKITPGGNALEFGCGAGNGTHHLSIGREVLSLDSNPQLIEKARIRTKENVKIHQCDFFELTEKDNGIIRDFKPQVIVGWFIGGCGIDIFKHTKEEQNEITKSNYTVKKLKTL